MALKTDDKADGIVAATPNQQTFKVLLIGQSRVGKTSIIRRFIKDKFTSHYKMTLGAVQWSFKCEVPIDLIEEVKTDELNRAYTMTNFLHQSTMHDIIEDDKNMQISPISPGTIGIHQSVDPFDDDDKNAEFGGTDDFGQFDYGDPQQLNYRLSNMDDNNDKNNNNNPLGDLFDFQSHGTPDNHHGDKSITDYGQFTKPIVTRNETTKDVRKVSMKLQITLDIVDMGFHPTDDGLYEDVNAIILCVDYTRKESLQNAIDKYQDFLKNSMYARSKKKRKRARSHSNGGSNRIEEQKEYIPIVVAVNKSDINKKKKQFKKKDVKKIINKKLRPIIDTNFPDSDTEVIEEEVQVSTPTDNTPKDGKSVTFGFNEASSSPTQTDKDKDNVTIRKKRNFTNATLLQPPNLSFVYDEGDDNKGSDSETDIDDDDSDDGKENKEKKKIRRIKVKKTSSDLLTIAHIYHKKGISHKGDPFNTPRAKKLDKDKKKRKKKSSKKVKKRNKSDIKYIDVISVSSKNGKNIEKLFGTCIKKTIPSKLTKSVAHKRTKTTAHVTAPIWLRQVVAEFQKDSTNEKHPFFEDEGLSDVDDNFHFLGDEDKDD